MNPEFASRMIQNLSEPLRSQILAELAKPVSLAPGLRKCLTKPATTRAKAVVNNGMSAQLNLFASRVSRVS